ncbi:hypothetical protein [Rhodanobacter sp. T12-5]|uniref:hypothetical protein n=1 Tax=Rhodanobacter sp. T12-5 TaxID=2024611 RepID=UPI0011F03F66|nr:hypothetical protein [Rhodanobacter sp. T12-5]KAA0070725.1 hypothetical protein CIW53_05080 [Rhodanobacter sp. T12-5]
MRSFSIDKDMVIGGYVVTASATYEEALKNFLPLIGRLDIQRDTLKAKFYARLEDDIVKGCVMPPITISLVDTLEDNLTLVQAEEFISDRIHDAFVLDGIQRLNTLSRAANREGFDAARPIYVNFVLAPSRDRLLYRMITLNNGQKAMSARHQIDALADAFFDFDGVEMNLVPEKGRGRVRAPDTFRKADFVKGYVAYLSDSVNIDNQKIIEEKMDELIAARIIDSDIVTRQREFIDVVSVINRMSQNEYLRAWIRVQNNFIGFCVGAKGSIDYLLVVGMAELEAGVRTFEGAFSSVDVSKVNLGRVRREVISRYISDIDNYMALDGYDLLDKISEWI